MDNIGHTEGWADRRTDRRMDTGDDNTTSAFVVEGFTKS